jgi:hypothetical protein
MRKAAGRQMSDSSSSDVGLAVRSVASRSIACAVFFLVLTLTTKTAYAQGCTQCRDNTAATSPATQRAYRHAIALMASAAGGFFLVTLAMMKRSR